MHMNDRCTRSDVSVKCSWYYVFTSRLCVMCSQSPLKVSKIYGCHASTSNTVRLVILSLLHYLINETAEILLVKKGRHQLSVPGASAICTILLKQFFLLHACIIQSCFIRKWPSCVDFSGTFVHETQKSKLKRFKLLKLHLQLVYCGYHEIRFLCPQCFFKKL